MSENNHKLPEKEEIQKEQDVKLIPDAIDEEECKIYKRFFAEFHSGPLPHPKILKEYNDLVPDAAERILQMAEKSQAHDYEIEGFYWPVPLFPLVVVLSRILF